MLSSKELPEARTKHVRKMNRISNILQRIGDKNAINLPGIAVIGDQVNNF